MNEPSTQTEPCEHCGRALRIVDGDVERAQLQHRPSCEGLRLELRMREVEALERIARLLEARKATPAASKKKA